MKSFLYGRYDVLRGARGYEIFAASREIDRQLIRQLTPCFSTQDPDFSMLQTLGEFFVYFPIGNGDWVFGKGNVEERGDYFYYMLHAIVLSESMRKALGYNPFRLASLLSPLIGDNRQLPELSANDFEQIKCNPLSLEQCLKALTGEGRGFRLNAVGLLLDHLLRLRKQSPGARLVFDYHVHCDANLWLMVYEMLPVSWRKQLSISSLDAFLKLPTHLQGSFQPSQKSDKIAYVPLQTGHPSTLGHFFNQLLEEPLELSRQKLQLLKALRDDTADEGHSAQTYADHLAAITKALVRPSIRTMQRWQEIDAGKRLFRWKAFFLGQIWQRHAAEKQLFPQVASGIVASMQKDFERLAPKLTHEEGNELKAVLNKLILQVEGLKNQELILMVLGSPSLAADYFPRLEDEDLAQALLDVPLSDKVFQKLLENRLHWRADWSEPLNALWGLRQTTQLPVPLLAQIFDSLLTMDTRFAIHQVITQRFLEEPEAFAEFLDCLSHSKQILSRFIGKIGRLLAHAEQKDVYGFRKLLILCHQKHPDRFEILVANWINQPMADRLMPKLAPDSELASVFLKLWLENAKDDLARLRVLYFTKKIYPNTHPYDWPESKAISVLKGNAMFECLLEV